jgi:hopanoid biosynthesis associated RND transporter like protein HpnN
MTSSATDNMIGRGLGRFTAGIQHRALLVVLLCLTATAGAGYYATGHLGINTDTTDMISDQLDWRRDFIEFREAFPILWRSLVVVIDADSADLAEDARQRLQAELTLRDDLFVFQNGTASDTYYQRQGLLYQELDELESLSDRLAQIQPFLGRLTRDPTLRGFADVLTLAARAGDEGATLEITRLMLELKRALAAASDNRFHRFPWQELMTPAADDDSNGRRRLILLQPRLDPARVAPARQAIEYLYAVAATLELDHAHGVSVRLTGPLALEYEELLSVSRGAGIAAVLTLVLVIGVLYAGLRSPALVFSALVTLICGLVITGAFAAVSVGRLNLISVAFAVLYIGLGIDFSAHLCLRYRELVLDGLDRVQALRLGASDVGASLLLCAVTTSIGFFAFLPTAFTGVSELGLISGVGMYISLLANLVLLPALLHLLPPRIPGAMDEDDTPASALPGASLQPTGGLAVANGLPLPQRHPWLVLAATAVITIAGIAALRLVSFDPNPLNLRDPDSPSVTAYLDLLSESSTSPLTLNLLVDGLDQARTEAARADGLPLVAEARTLAAFVPQAQADKLALIEDLAFIVGPDLDVDADPAPLDHPQRVDALDTLQSALTDLASDPANSDRELTEATLAVLNRFRDQLDEQADAAADRRLALFEESLMNGFAPQMQRLALALQARAVTMEDLPTDLTARWVTPDGRHRVELLPRENLADNEAMRRFVDQARELNAHITGLPVVQLGAGDAVIDAFVQAIVSALALVALLLLVLLRSLRDSLRVIAPVIIASILTAAATIGLGIDFNFANVIALPLLLGMGVDNGIHLVHRFRAAPPTSGNLLSTSTARAIVLSAATTIVSFASLALSEHPGTASMGLLLAAGLGLILVSTLVVLPAMLQLELRDHRRSE